MQTTLRIDDDVYRQAKAEAARTGVTLTRFIEEALRDRVQRGSDLDAALADQERERDRLMEGLLQATAHFRVGKHPTREEMNER
jgi:hypothetical protein